jgi:hypothetical protein
MSGPLSSARPIKIGLIEKKSGPKLPKNFLEFCLLADTKIAKKWEKNCGNFKLLLTKKSFYGLSVDAQAKTYKFDELVRQTSSTN